MHCCNDLCKHRSSFYITYRDTNVYLGVGFQRIINQVFISSALEIFLQSRRVQDKNNSNTRLGTKKKKKKRKRLVKRKKGRL